MGGGRERTLTTSHAVVARAWYVPDEKSGFLIRLLDHGIWKRQKARRCRAVQSFHPTKQRCGEKREERETSAADEGASLLHSTCSGAQLPIPTAVSLCHTSLVDYVVNVSEGRVLNPPSYYHPCPTRARAVGVVHRSGFRDCEYRSLVNKTEN